MLEEEIKKQGGEKNRERGRDRKINCTFNVEVKKLKSR